MPVSSAVIASFVYDDENEDKLWEHGIVREQVDDVQTRPHTVRRNRRHRRAPLMVIGLDRSGQCIAIPVEPTYDPVVWRPVTAWYCKESEAVRLPR